MPTDETKLALLEQQVGYLVKGFDTFSAKFEEFQNQISNKYVSKGEFELLKEELTAIKDDRKTARSTIISWVSVGISAISTIVAVIAVIKKF